MARGRLFVLMTKPINVNNPLVPCSSNYDNTCIRRNSALTYVKLRAVLVLSRRNHGPNLTEPELCVGLLHIVCNRTPNLCQGGRLFALPTTSTFLILPRAREIESEWRSTPFLLSKKPVLFELGARMKNGRAHRARVRESSLRSPCCFVNVWQV